MAEWIEDNKITVSAIHEVGYERSHYKFTDKQGNTFVLHDFFIADKCFVNVNNEEVICFDELNKVDSISKRNNCVELQLKNGKSYQFSNMPIHLFAQGLHEYFNEEDSASINSQS